MVRVLSGQQFNGGRTEHTWANLSTRSITNAWEGKQNAKKIKLNMKKIEKKRVNARFLKTTHF